jgi:hypothetical protein
VIGQPSGHQGQQDQPSDAEATKQRLDNAAK